MLLFFEGGGGGVRRKHLMITNYRAPLMIPWPTDSGVPTHYEHTRALSNFPTVNLSASKNIP